LNIKAIRAHWDEILRLATSIKQGTVTASLMLRKLGSYPRQNGLACAARAGAHRAHAVHWTGCKAWNYAVVCMPD
jgi:TnpA family transposase